MPRSKPIREEEFDGEDVVEVGPPVPKVLLAKANASVAASASSSKGNPSSEALLKPGVSSSTSYKASASASVSSNGSTTACGSSSASIATNWSVHVATESVPSSAKRRGREEAPSKVPGWVEIYFYTEPNDPEFYWCKICKESKIRKGRRQQSKTGWSNLSGHMNSSHPNWKEWNEGEGPSVLKYFSKEAHNIFDWIEFVVETNQPFSAVEDPVIRRCTKMDNISVDTLMRYSASLIEKVEKRVAAEIGRSFGICFDAWSENSEHFVGMFAIYLKADEVRKALLAFSPLLDESDLSAESYKDWIEAMLQFYGATTDKNVLYLSGDNCSVNRCLATRLNLPLVGCYSHRFQLAVKEYLKDYEILLTDINSIMKHYSTIKAAGELRKQTDLVAKKRCVTRWSGDYLMVKRYFALEEFMDKDSEEVAHLFPRGRDKKLLDDLLRQLEKLNTVTLSLQSESKDLADARLLFDEVMEWFPSEYLTENAGIIHDVVFEKAVVKAILGEALDENEKSKLEKFKVVEPELKAEEDSGLSFSERARLKKLKKIEENSPSSGYMNMKIVIPTSNVCERLFSIVGHVYNDRRKAMTPRHLEMLVYLKTNREFWSVEDIQAIFDEREEQRAKKRHKTIE